MLKFPAKIILTILLSPAFASPLAAMEDVQNTKEKISKSIETALKTIQGDNNQATEVNKQTQLDADAREKQAVEKSLSDAEQMAKSASSTDEVTQKSITKPQQSNGSVSSLINMEQFKVCSLGHDSEINNFEYVKQSQITQAATIMKFTAGSNPNYKCEMLVLSESQQDVTLKCWHGNKYSEGLTTYKLSYFFNQAYLFSQGANSKLVMIKPIVNNQDNNCPSNFVPASSTSSTDTKTEEEKEGLAGLTF